MVALPGDIILQTEYSAQSWAVREVTGSIVTHVGVLVDFDGDGTLEVLEAAGPVGVVSLEDFGYRGPTQLRRLRNRDIHAKNIEDNLVDAGIKYLDRPYDAKFKWDDENIYCSELVWKAYNDIGINVSPKEKLSDLDLTGPLAKRLIAARLGPGEAIDNEEVIVTPASLERSAMLENVR